jgi:methionyl-tRNA synthetase
MNARNRFYLTTAIDYPKQPAPYRHRFEKIGADVQARYRRMEGYDVFF